MTKHRYRVSAMTFGIAFIVVMLVIAFWKPEPTTFQLWVFRVVLSLAAAGTAAMIPGALSVDIGPGVQAGGALSVFAILMFFTPAAIVTQPSDVNGPDPDADPPPEETVPNPGPGTSNFGEYRLSAGFRPDPWGRPVVSGGPIDAATRAPSCAGYIHPRPDIIIVWSGASDLLRVFFEGDGDGTLVVEDPNGDRWCNDDSYGTIHPTVDIVDPPEGRYEIKVGSYTAGEEIGGTLFVTERVGVHPGS
ncbi:MAG: hypothetical protein ACODAB_07980 [Gemmatimonadota bacterium]